VWRGIAWMSAAESVTGCGTSPEIWIVAAAAGRSTGCAACCAPPVSGEREPNAVNNVIVIVRPHARMFIFVCILRNAFGDWTFTRGVRQSQTTV